MQAGAAAPACNHLSPHQHRAESFTLKRDAGEGNQRGGVYEHIVFFLNIKLFFFFIVLDIFNTLKMNILLTISKIPILSFFATGSHPPKFRK